MGASSKKESPSISLSSLWAVISNFGDESIIRGEVFVKGLSFCVGDRASVRFRFDDWVGVGP